MNNRIGQEFGAYRLTSLLGNSTYTEVYLGEHRRVQGQAAIKLFNLPSTSWGWAVFQQTCQRASGLVHPRIVRVLDFDQQAGISFLVLEYLPDGSLKQRYAPGIQVPLKIVVDYVQQVAEALHYAHSQHMLHLGIKPTNLQLNRQQEIMVSDFGISAFARSLLPPQMGMAPESVAYMAPEQLQGQAGLASDQYALAVCAYQWLRGTLPFQGNASEIITGHLSTQPPSLLPHVPGLPAAVEQVLLTALSKNPSERFSNIQAFSQALEQASHQNAKSSSIAPTHVVPIPSANAQDYPARYLAQPQPGFQVLPPTPATLSQPGSASQPPAQSVPVVATPHPSSPLAQPYPPYPQAPQFAPTPQRVSRRAMIGGALGIGTAGVLATLCTRTAIIPTILKSFSSSAGSSTTSTPTVVPDPRLLYTYLGQKDYQSSLTWSPDNTRLATTIKISSSKPGVKRKSIHVWDVLTGTHVSIFNTPTNGYASGLADDVVWTPNGPCTCWLEEGPPIVLHITNVVSGRDVSTYVVGQDDGIFGGLSRCHWSPDGKYLAAAATDVLVWEIATGKKVAAFPPSDTGPTYDLSWSPDGKLIVAWYDHGAVAVWDLSSGRQVSSYQKYVKDVPRPQVEFAWSSDSKNVATIAENSQTIDIWNAQDGKQLYTYTNIDPQQTALMGWSADDSMFAAIISDGTTVWSNVTHKVLHVQQQPTMQGATLPGSWAPNASRLAGLKGAMLPQDGIDISGAVLSVWDAATGQHQINYVYPASSPYHIVWSPNGKYIATSYNSGAVCVWKAT